MVLMRKEILDIVRAGGNVTHMLTVEVANSAAAEDAEREALVLALLANKPITRRLRGQHDVTLTWRPVGDGRSPHALLFYCDSQFFNDVAVANHTEIVLREILRPAVGDVFVTVTKPLFRSVAMVDEETEGFDPNHSRVGQKSLADFIRAPVTGDLSEVPGVGRATIEALQKDGITTTFQLFGKYLSLKEAGVASVEHADRFYYWLRSLKTPPGYRAGVVLCVAEKMNITFPGIYNGAAYGADPYEDEMDA